MSTSNFHAEQPVGWRTGQCLDLQATTETRVGDEWTDRTLRLSADSARSLAAALVRAADIKQGLDR